MQQQDSPKIKEGKFEKKRLDIQERLASIIRIISGRKDLRVVSEMDEETYLSLKAHGSRDPKKEWFYKRRMDSRMKQVVNEYVYIPPEIYETSEDIAMGKAAHEAGHVLITRYLHFVPEKTLKSEIGLAATLASAEERPTDAVVGKHREAAGKMVFEMRKTLRDEGEEALKARTGSAAIPFCVQLCDLIVFGDYFEKYPAEYAPEVIAAYERIKNDIKEMENILPERGAKEKEVMLKARARYKAVYRKIWPEVKKFVERDRQEAEAKKMLEKMTKKEKKEQLDKVDKDLKQELEELMKKIEKEIEREKSVGEDGEGDESEINDKKERIFRISKKLLKILMRIFESLPEEVKEQIRVAAERDLQDYEDAIVRERAGKLTEEKIFSHEAIRKEQEEAEKIEQLRQELEERKAQAEEEKDVYERYYQQVQQFEEVVYQTLQAYFTPNLRAETRLTATGARLNLPAVFRMESSRAGGSKELDIKIFETSSTPEKKDYAVTLLVDLSGSMSGEKIEEAFKGVVVLTEVLNRLGIKFEVKGFQDKVIDFKNFDEELDNAKRKKMSGMLIETEDRNPGGNNHAGHNFDGPCLLDASKTLGAASAKEKFLIVISDGLPCPSDFWSAPEEKIIEAAKQVLNENNKKRIVLSSKERRTIEEYLAGGLGLRYATVGILSCYLSGEWELSSAIEKIMSNTEQKLIGVGLGPDTEHVKTFYPVSMPNVQIQDFAEVLGGLLKAIITNPKGFQTEFKK